jgi:uncharacterized protein (DUF1330 family)
MTAYLLFIRDEPVHDPETMAKYQQIVAANRSESFNMKPLHFYGAVEGIEGKAPDGLVMLEFPTTEEAKAWYNSPGYQEALPFRQKAADYRVMLVEGFSPPA